MADARTLYAARRNGHGSHQYVAPGSRPINADRVVVLLAGADHASAHVGVRRAANILLSAMATGPWRVTAGPHKGGLGGKTYSVDDNLHVTVSVKGKGYHLRLRRSHELRRVTGDDGAELVPPWIGPGTAIPLRSKR